MKCFRAKPFSLPPVSPLAEGRELKFVIDNDQKADWASPLAEGRELKYDE